MVHKGQHLDPFRAVMYSRSIIKKTSNINISKIGAMNSESKKTETNEKKMLKQLKAIKVNAILTPGTITTY